MQQARTVIGVFDEGAMADQAVAALENAGFTNTQIHRHGQQATGGFLAGLRNMFGGDANRTADANASDFTDLGVSGDEANYYENESQAGHHIVSVRAEGREEEALSILRANGAYNYGMRHGGTGTTTTTTAYDNTTVDPTRTGNATTYDNTTVDPTQATNATTYDNTTVDPTRTGNAAAYDTTQTTGVADTEAQRLRLREEQLNVDKQRVQSGEVGLHKDVISEEKVIDVPVTHEEAFIERRPVTDATINDNTPIGEGETIRVPLSEEQVNVSKNTVVTGEVEVGKRAVTENQRVSDTVRREEARLERDGDVRVSGTENDPTLSDRTNLTDRTTDDRNL